MEINRESLAEILKTFDVKPDKDYGQNFLVEPNVSSKIVESLNINDSDKVLEIGPGLGSLTHFISLKAKDYSVVDIDPRMANFIENAYKNTGINVICNDIRKVDVSNYTKIISNLPYNITTETIQYILKNGNKAEELVLMCQSENFAHFKDVSGSEYGPISVLIHLVGSVQSLFAVKAGSFYPAPKCSSQVFKISIDRTINKEKMLKVYIFAKNVFLNRRKTFLNNVSRLFDKEKCLSVLKELNLKDTIRPEEIKPEEYLKIYDLLNK